MSAFPWETEKETRTPRDIETRESEFRQWQPASILPDPSPRDGLSFRWVRAETLNVSDDRNFSAKRREGWEPARAEDHPELMLEIDPDRNRYAARGNIEFGGLILCKMPTEMVEQRKRYYDRIANQQVEGVNANFLSESDRRSNMRTSELEFKTRHGDRVEGQMFHGVKG